PGQVAGAEDLEVVRRRVACDSEVLFALTDDLVRDGGRQAVSAEAADRQIVAVVDQPANGVAHRRDLVHQGTRLGGEKSAGVVGRWIGEERPVPLRWRWHGG